MPLHRPGFIFNRAHTFLVNYRKSVTLKQGTLQSAIGFAVFHKIPQTKEAELTRFEEAISEEGKVDPWRVHTVSSLWLALVTSLPCTAPLSSTTQSIRRE